jgi:protein TonB
MLVGFAASLAAHWIAARALPAPAARPTPREATSSATYEAPGATPTTLAAAVGWRGGPPTARAPALAGGSTSRVNVDAERDGRGGEASGAYEVILLVSREAPLTLVDAPLVAADRSQIQRIDTGDARASWEDRRATPNPRDEVFLASGTGPHRERRPAATADAREGARTAPVASVEGAERTGASSRATSSGGVTGGAEAERELPSSAAAARAIGAERASPGSGILRGEGVRPSVAAAVATGRPSVDRGPAATLAERRARPSDDVDAELLAASLFESQVDASRRAGARPGEGAGGQPWAGAGAGSGDARGGVARPYGPGAGGFDALDTSDPRYRRWLLELRRRIEARLEFPRARQLARDQGTSVVRLTVRRDGSIGEAPRVIRSSGFDDLDAAALRAVERSLPFAPIPADLAPGRPALVVTLPIEFSNPMVR